MLGSVAAVIPGLMFRNHYFLFVLPATGLMAGIALSAGARQMKRVVSPSTSLALVGMFLAAALSWSVVGEWRLLVSLPDAEVTRAIYGSNPFPESLEIADYLRRSSAPTDKIAVIGSEPQLYFYANRRAATSYIYTYALMEEQPFALRMQQEMIQQIERNQPKFIVYVQVPSSWLGRPTTTSRTSSATSPSRTS